MEVQNHPNPDEVTPDQEPVVAKPGGKYPIRILHLINGMLIIGFVIAVYPETTMVLRPFIVEPMYDNPESMNVSEYDFVPYMDQMAHYDPHDLIPVPFMNAATISITRPAQHLVQNYTSIIQLRETIHATDDTVQIYRRHYVDTSTLH